MVIPHERLEPDTLCALIEEFITRDGAVQGHSIIPLATMMQEVLGQLETGTAAIVFDEVEETCSIMVKDRMPSEESLRIVEPCGEEVGNGQDVLL